MEETKADIEESRSGQSKNVRRNGDKVSRTPQGPKSEEKRQKLDHYIHYDLDVIRPTVSKYESRQRIIANLKSRINSLQLLGMNKDDAKFRELVEKLIKEEEEEILELRS